MKPEDQKKFLFNPILSNRANWLTVLHQELSQENRLKILPRIGSQSLSSNDYLGLSHHPDIISATTSAIHEFGIGATGSRFLSGNHPLNAELESTIAEFKSGGKGQGIVFSSGYHANLSITTVLGKYSSAIYSDKENHASLIDGLRSTKTPIFIYPHNDWEWVKNHMASQKPARPIIVTESVFSMSGDLAPIKDLYCITKIFGGILVIDDAHGTGTLGGSGRGVLEEQQMDFDPECMVITGTFSKALGSLGGFSILGNKEKEIILSLARPFIYTTGLPPGNLVASLSALHVLKKNPDLVEKLQENSAYWNNALLGKKSSVPIISITGNPEQLSEWSKSLEEKGFFLPVLKYPTVPVGFERLRLSVNLDWEHRTIQAVRDTFKISGTSP